MEAATQQQRAPSRARRPSGSSRRCARASPGAAWRARRSTTSPARRACRAGCCTTTSGPRSGCWPRSCAATASCAWPLLDDQLAPARNADDVIDALVASLKRSVEEEPEFITVVFELFTLSRRNEEIASEFAELAASHARARGRAAGAQAGRGRAAPARRARGRGRRALLAGRRHLPAHAHGDRPRLRGAPSTPACSPCAPCSTERLLASAAWISVPCNSRSRTPTAPTPTRRASR